MREFKKVHHNKPMSDCEMRVLSDEYTICRGKTHCKSNGEMIQSDDDACDKRVEINTRETIFN